MKKKFLIIMLALSMITAFIPVIASAAESGTCGDNVNWVLDDDGTLTISGTGDMADYNSSDNLPPFLDNSSIKSVVIENGVTSIGDSVFAECRSLASITIPDSVTSIGESAFWDCNSLTSVTIPDSVKGIGNCGFYHCDNLTSITIPNGITVIGDWAFYQCGNLTSVTIPDSVKSIGNWAFYHCDSLTSITIPNSVKSIGKLAFADCMSLTKVKIPDSIMSIGKSAFYDCITLNDVYYSGTEAMWNEIDISDKNDCLLNATIHYNSVVPECFTIEYSDGYATVTNTENEEYTATVITADYSNGVLTNLNAEKRAFAAGESYTIAVNSNARVFVWDSLAGMKPLTKE